MPSGCENEKFHTRTQLVLQISWGSPRPSCSAAMRTLEEQFVPPQCKWARPLVAVTGSPAPLPVPPWPGWRTPGLQERAATLQPRPSQAPPQALSAPPPDALAAQGLRLPVKRLPAVLRQRAADLATAKSKSMPPAKSPATGQDQEATPSSSGALVPVPQHQSKPSLPDLECQPALVSKATMQMWRQQQPVTPRLMSKTALLSVRPKAALFCVRPKPTRRASRSRSPLPVCGHSLGEQRAG